MSSYFSQLLATSGVRIADQPAPAPIESAMAPAAPNIVELSQETYVEYAPAAPPPLAPNERVEPIMIEQPVPAPQSPTTQETARAESVASTGVSSPESPEEETTVTISVPQASALPTPPQLPQRAASPEEIIGSVMKWVAAGESSQPEAKAPPAIPIVPAREPRASPPRTTTSVFELQPPARPIMKTEVAPAIAFDPVIAEPKTAPVANSPRAPADPPPSITIGAIHLRVEAPAPPAPAAPRPSAPPIPPAPPNKSDGWLKLRRYGVLPY
jgi:hypothetical protein